MPMTPFPTVDFGSRIGAIIKVGTALSVPANQLPSPNAANSDKDCLKWINNCNTVASLPLYTSLDFSSFTSALNALVAKVP